MANVEPRQARRSRWRAALMGTLILLGKVLVPAYIALVALAYFYQDALIFMPQARSERELQAIAARHAAVEEVRLPAGEGVTLHGWFLNAGGSRSSRAPLLVYYGGNAEEVSWLLDEAGRFAGYSLLLVNYRGYGGSAGKPGEAVLYADALRVFDYAAQRADIDAARIVIMGRSLGTALAVRVAARRTARAVVLVSPYDSMVALGRRHHPYLPVSLLMRNRFEALADAPQAKAPLLTLVATRDSLVPVEHSRRLFEAWGGPRAWREIEGAEHNDISSFPGYWQAIAAFLAEMRGKSSGGEIENQMPTS
jgi:dipeptidyl aminopeptidase/acylaminoacyl peptidase